MTTMAEGALLAPQRLLRQRRALHHDGIDVRGLERALTDAVDGEVRFDGASRGLYALDASNYRHVPLGVVIPRTRAAIVAAVAACRAHGAPITARGGGTALAGQTCNEAVIFDFSKYQRRILALDPVARRARVELGVVCDDLVRAAAPHGLTWGPQPATHDHCCFGGMIANNCGGIHAQMAGTAVHNVESLDVVLYDGTEMRVGWARDDGADRTIASGGRVGQIYAALRAFRERYEDEIRARYPQIPRRVSGYNLDQLLPDEDGRFNVARALVGSEGTLVTMLEAEVRLVERPQHRLLIVLGFEDVFRAADAIPALLEHGPIGLEGLDRRLHDHIATRGGLRAKYLSLLPAGEAWLLVELGAETAADAQDAGRAVLETARASTRAIATKIVIDAHEQHALWEVRESGLGATAFVPGEPDAWPGWEDSAVAPDRLGGYLRDLRALFDRFGYDPALYGHFGQGLVHCRVDFDLTSASGIDKYRAFVDEATELVVRYGGSLSGEHGDGQARAEELEKMFGPTIVGAFREFKRIWDPDGKMNPGRIVDPLPLDRGLKLGADYAPWRSPTPLAFAYPDDDGSFAHATLRCVGVGKCRRTGGEGENQTMCPSFMVTHEEKHTTRGRAHLLWEMLQNGPVEGHWTSEAVKESLDLCLACKGCKGDCPVNVDIATYKAEFLSHYYETKRRPIAAYAFGLVDQWARLASKAPGLVNLVTQTPGLSALAKLAANVPQARSLPAFAPEPFTTWFARRPRRHRGAPQVVLFADTFNNYFVPDTAKAAVHVLETAGFEVVVPRGHLCCGRPLYDYGMVDRAKRYADRVLRALRPHLDAGRAIVVLEPSCASVFRDEVRNLWPDRPDAQRLVAQTKLLSEVLREAKFEPPPLHRHLVVQGHCHHKSVLGFDAEADLLRDMGAIVDVLDSGCCGMAGAFGYERDKYDVSIAAGERVLLPAVRRASAATVVVADGFSCREQIAQETDRHGFHLAEVISLALTRGPEGGRDDRSPSPAPVEASTIARRRSAVRRSIARAALGIAALALTTVFAWRTASRARG